MNTQEVDRIIAAELRITYAETYWSMTPWQTTVMPLVAYFLENAFAADDYTLCELEALYHASRNAGEFTWDEEN